MPWWRRDEHEAVDVEAAHFRHPHSADPWPAGPFSLAPQFEHQRSHLWGAGKLELETQIRQQLDNTLCLLSQTLAITAPNSFEEHADPALQPSSSCWLWRA